MTPGGSLYSLTPGGAPCSKFVLFTIFIQQTPFKGHSTAVKNVTKVWKTETGSLQGGRAWSRGPESELFEILPYRDHELTANQHSRFGPSGLDWLVIP